MEDLKKFNDELEKRIEFCMREVPIEKKKQFFDKKVVGYAVGRVVTSWFDYVGAHTGDGSCAHCGVRMAVTYNSVSRKITAFCANTDCPGGGDNDNVNA